MDSIIVFTFFAFLRFHVLKTIFGKNFHVAPPMQCDTPGMKSTGESQESIFG